MTLLATSSLKSENSNPDEGKEMAGVVGLVLPLSNFPWCCEEYLDEGKEVLALGEGAAVGLGPLVNAP